jgi:hypothetical protein
LVDPQIGQTLQATPIETAKLHTADNTGFLMVPVIACSDGGDRSRI